MTDSVKCPSCDEGQMALVVGWETPWALRCECGEYFYCLGSISAVRVRAPADREAAAAMIAAADTRS